MSADGAQRQLEACREAAARDPADPAAWRGLVAAAAALGRWPEVAAGLDRLIPLARDRAELADLHAQRAEVLDDHLGDRDGARRHHEAALQAQPDQPWAWLALVRLDLRERRWSRALAHVDHAMELAAPTAPERPWLLLARAIAARRVTTSLSPQSSFMRALAPDPGAAASRAERAYQDASRALPELAGLSFRAFVDDEAAAVRFVVEGAPRRALAER